MNIFQLKNDIYSNDKNKQYKAAKLMGNLRNDPEAVRILYSACYEANDPKLQQEAVRSLKQLVGRKAMETFIKSTYSRDPNKRMRAYYHLGTLGDHLSLEEVLKGLADGDPRVRRAAVLSSGRLGSTYRVVNMLKKLLNGFEDRSVTDAAKTAIAMIEEKLQTQPRNPSPSRCFNGGATPYLRNSRPKSFNNDPEKESPIYRPKGF